MLKKVSIIGHFGFGENSLGGQTIKTKTVTQEIVFNFGNDQVIQIDTHGGKKALPRLLLQSISALRKTRNVIILPAHNGLRVFVPVLNFFNKVFRRKLFYVVIGGWLPSYLKDKKGLTKKLKKFNGIFVETNSMKSALENMGFENVKVMPNCKKLQILKEGELVYPQGEPYKLCTFSRVMKEKGIEDAVNAVKAVNEELGRTVYTLDIYGQVDERQTEWFENLKQEFPEYIKYGGLVPFDKSVEILKDYLALLFPTYYEGEGFAGTILDSFSAGVPIIASDWRYNAEIVKNGESGYIFVARNCLELQEILKDTASNAQNLLNMKYNCLQKAEKFLPSNVIKVLIEQLS